MKQAWPYLLIATAGGLYAGSLLAQDNLPLAAILPVPFLAGAWFVARYIGGRLTVVYLVAYALWLCPAPVLSAVAGWLLVPLAWHVFSRAARVRIPEIWIAYVAAGQMIVFDLAMPGAQYHTAAPALQLAGTFIFLAIGYRRRIVACRLLLVGALFTVAPAVARPYLGDLEALTAVAALTLLAWPFFAVYALHRRELGPLERPASQALIGAAFVAVYLDLMIILLLLIGRQLQWPADFAIAAITITAVAVLLVLPSLEMFSGAMQRLIYGRVFDPGQVVAMLAAATPATMELAAVGPLVDKALRRYLGIERMALYLEGERLPALLYASAGAPAVLEKVPGWVELPLPLTLRGMTIGRLLLGGKAHDSFYAPHEVAQLWTLSEHVAAMVEVARQVQEIERLHGQVAEQERMAALGRMVASVGHEFATPLQIAKVALQIMPDARPDEVDDFRTAALAQIEHLSRLVAGLRNSTQPAPAELVDDVNEIAREVSGRDGVEITLALHDEVMPAWITKMELRQALANLVANAIDAGGRHVTITTAAGEGGPIITVLDDGPGIPDTLLSSIFDPFTSTKAIGGAGLGLYTVYSTVQRRGGRLEAASGDGAIITIYLLANPTEHMRRVAGKMAPGAYLGRI